MTTEWAIALQRSAKYCAESARMYYDHSAPEKYIILQQQSSRATYALLRKEMGIE